MATHTAQQSTVKDHSKLLAQRIRSLAIAHFELGRREGGVGLRIVDPVNLDRNKDQQISSVGRSVADA